MADITIDASVQTIVNIRARHGRALVWTSPTIGYVFYVDSTGDLVFRKTTDGGLTWSGITTINTGDITGHSLWFDKWTLGDSGTKIHVAYNDNGANQHRYRSLDTNGDVLGTDTLIVSDSGGSGYMDITKARNGDLYAGGWGNTGAAPKFAKSTDGGSVWDSTIASPLEGTGIDPFILMPGNETDTADIWAIYWDSTANEISLKVYDNSLDSWSETLISTGYTESVNFIQFDAVTRHSDNRGVLQIWTQLDNAASDLTVWEIENATTFTQKTDVLTNTAEATLASLVINQQNDDLYAFYVKGATWQTAVGVKYKKSADGATTWGSEVAFSEGTDDDLRYITGTHSVGNDGGRIMPAWFNDDLDDLLINKVNSVEIGSSVRRVLLVT